MPVQRRTVVGSVAAVVTLVALTGVASVVSQDAADRQASSAPTSTTVVGRRSGERAAPADVDGDGRTDLVVYRAPTATFWVKQSSGGQLTVPLGQPGDQATVGDFDGDGRADLVAITPGADGRSDTWTIRSSGDASLRSVAFGLPGDVAVPGDFDGDGVDDLAVYRPPAPVDDGADAAAPDAAPTPTATWYVHRSTSADPKALLVVPFGLAGDQPAPADYDGDGMVDLAVQRVDARWILRSSVDEPLTVAWGQAWDQPVVLDRDGDGAAEVAVLRQEVGAVRWYVRPADGEEAEVITFGRAVEPDQQPLVGDFDGNGSTEPAVFEPGTGSFWIWQPDGARVETWGRPGDVALP